MCSSESGKKIALTRQSISKRENTPSPSSSREFPSLPIHQNKFEPLTPFSSKARPPYSVLAKLQNIPTSPITPPRPSIPVSAIPKSSSSSSEYVVNPNRQVIKILEPYEEQTLKQSFQSLIEYLYPKNSHFYNNDYQNREYYQAILVDSGSVIIEHTMNQKNPDYIDCSKVKIIKVITPEEWSIKPYSHKVLSGYPSYPIYNYYDYQEAWFKTFLLRSFNHTWFFYFSDKFSNIYPRWFVKWFRYMGMIPEAFPPIVLEGYKKFKFLYQEENLSNFEYTLQFVVLFKLPWIMQFTYKKQEATDTNPPLFYRQYNVKWWKKIKEEQASPKAVIEFYNLSVIPSASSSTPVPNIQDGDFISRLQACSSPAEIQKIINEIKRSPTPSEDLFQDAQDPYDEIVLN